MYTIFLQMNSKLLICETHVKYFMGLNMFLKIARWYFSRILHYTYRLKSTTWECLYLSLKTDQRGGYWLMLVSYLCKQYLMLHAITIYLCRLRFHFLHSPSSFLSLAIIIHPTTTLHCCYAHCRKSWIILFE